jgi:hypothetical protein
MAIYFKKWHLHKYLWPLNVLFLFIFNITALLYLFETYVSYKNVVF